jgi:adenylate cyclase
MSGLSAWGSWLRGVVRRAGRVLARYWIFDRVLALGLLLAMLGIRIWDPLPVETLRLRVFDGYQSLLPRQSTARPVVVADIDEASIAALGQWPWPRTQMADLVTKLKSLGALAIGFDIIFPEPDRMSPASISKGLPQLDSLTRAALESLPSNDEVFAAAMKDARVVLGETALGEASDGRSGKPKVGFATVGPSALPFVRRFPALLPNIAVLEQAAAGHGLFTISPESDGIVRRVPMVIAVGHQLFPSLTLEILRVLTGSGGILLKTDQTGVLGIGLPGFQLPTDPRGQVWVHFAEHVPNRFISVKDILSGEVPRARIAGKIVLVGTSALGLLDNKTTPVSRSMPGVEVHAQVLEGALSNGMLHQPNYALAIEVLAALATGLAIIIFAPLLGPLILLLLGAVVAAGLAAFSWWNYKNDSLLIDATYPLLSSWIVYSALTFMNYLREQLGRRRIRQAFSQYMSPALVSQLSQSSEKLVLGGEMRVMSIMFSDVRGFTTISESYKRDPQGLTTLMNRFLTPLTNAIIDHNGTIDKYMGDAIMAFWNAPLKDDNQERNACLAALDMQHRLMALNAERAAEAEAEGKAVAPLDVGIGINTGECVVGNMGSDLRFDYSVLGDTVNLASRLEGQSKTYGIRTILGDATAKAVKDSFAVVELDLLQVKGKKEPEAVWTLLGDGEIKQQAEFQTLATTHGEMLSRYRGRDFEGAESLLETCGSLGSRFGLNGLYELYRERIAVFKQTPPPEDWTGVYTATSK